MIHHSYSNAHRGTALKLILVDEGDPRFPNRYELIQDEKCYRVSVHTLPKLPRIRSGLHLVLSVVQLSMNQEDSVKRLCDSTRVKAKKPTKA